ncbi:MAG: 50S ribosomal protein L25/general stress protein Ctc [Candidatus Omnitrophica bacterium]|nr:50S ribosomal protein L25/general stress protein Ctc [Candidatus Omnitrophota bacterium]
MKEIKINAQVRETAGKEASRRLRKEGLVPAVVYNKGKKSLALTISERDLIHALHTSAGGNVIIGLNIKKGGKAENKTVIIKDLQHHPIKSSIIHIDFVEISLNQSITVKVPVHPIGEAIGIKQDGGILDHILWEVEIECLPGNIPERIDVVIDELGIGDMIHIKDLKVKEGVKILNNPEDTVLAIEHPKIEEEVPEEEEVKAGEEPEVIGEKEREEKQKDKVQGKEGEGQEKKQG